MVRMKGFWRDVFAGKKQGRIMHFLCKIVVFYYGLLWFYNFLYPKCTQKKDCLKVVIQYKQVQ